MANVKHTLEEFVIQFSGLKEGFHSFQFDIERSFFECFEWEVPESANIHVDLEFEKKVNMLVLDFDISGTITVPCDRCATPVDVEVEHSERLMVKFGEQDLDDESIVVLHDTAHQIDVSRMIHEFIELGTPRKRAHEEEEDCDQQALDALDQYTLLEEDKNEPIDPRWEALKKLK